ncbi:MAG: zinc-binding dehydrogenase, partial [Streptomyces sp.]|nr:zinc-binding dehydrogenase [Streptomyces sp.]
QFAWLARMNRACSSVVMTPSNPERAGNGAKKSGSTGVGIVVRVAANGDGPQVGSRVVGFGEGGGFAALRVLDVADLAVVPDGVDLGEAAALPVAAGTALRALEQTGPLLGRRVLVTGASGGVGGFAVQLAVLGGAYVIGVAGSEDGRRWVDGLGADEAVSGPERVTRSVDIVIDNVGDAQLVTAYGLLASGGTLRSVGWASGGEAARSAGSGSTLGRPGGEAALPVGSTLGSPAPRSIVSVHNGGGLTYRRAQLDRLLALVAAGKLRVPVGWRGPWVKVADAVAALSERRLRGKAVLDVG